MKQPRDYQLEAVDATFRFFSAFPHDLARNPLIALPTGTGKSVVIAGTICRMLQSCDPYHKFIMVTHDSELVKQNADELREWWPGAPLGIHASGLKSRETAQPVIFGTIQSIIKTLDKNPAAFGARHTMLVDEAHCIPPKETSMYQRAIAALRSQNPNMRFVGYTATGYRAKMGLLTEGGLFSDFALDLTGMDAFNEFIRNGHLSPLVARQDLTKIDVSGVKITAGDFNARELEKASNKESVTRGAVAEMLAYGADRRKWLIFTSGIDHCESVVRILEEFHVDCDFVHSRRAGVMNEKAIRDFKHGNLRALVNANKLTTGFNCPEIDLIAMLRATTSPVLHVQMAGRGTRPAPGKRNCLYLDFARNVSRLGPINDPRVPGKPGQRSGAAPPAKECPKCKILNHCSVRECFFCGHEFEIGVSFSTQASDVAPLAGFEAPQVQIWPVTITTYHRQMLKEGRVALRVMYSQGTHSASKLVLLEHAGYPRKLAESWWRERANRGGVLANAMVPTSVNHALELTHHLAKPKEIRVSKAQHEKYWTVQEEIF
ncbi:type I site specific restriction modification protein [Caudoviricetes sp.]|nr:type I site specific restriction modification protein [Caudoviricetes sp.]